jgi:hypothetical protein
VSPRLSQSFQRRYWNLVFSFASKVPLAGVPIGTLLPQHPRSELLAKMRAAVELIAKFDPAQLDRFQRHVRHVLIFDLPGALGTWVRGPKLILLSEAFVAASDSSDAEVAATIVHETTHAWMEARGFVYQAERRRRIEAICYRAEAKFARRLPDGEALASSYDERAARVLAQSDSDWSDAAFLEKDLARLRTLYIPEWLAERFLRRKTRRVA